MNYRHIFHAGHICDVVKHAVLMLSLEHLREKDKAFCVLDTHAGIGLYDLQSEQAVKTAEAQEGVCKLLAAPRIAELENYYAVIEKVNPGLKAGDASTLSHFRFYPGSPTITQQMLRDRDRLVACELHDEDYAALRYKFYNLPRAHIHHRDGYEAMQALLPPAEKRGLVLIDAPFEEPSEFDRLAKSVVAACRRWPQGQFLIWYPVKERPVLWRFHEALATSGIAKILCAEFIYHEETRSDRLNGCGLIMINPAWQMDEKLKALLPRLHEAMQTGYRGTAVKWLSEAN